MLLKNLPAIAVVLTDRDILSISKEALKGADLIELRVDMFETCDDNLNTIENIFALAKKKFNLPILCTIRSSQEGGKKDIDNRLQIYERLIPYCEFFDIEIFSKEATSLRQISQQHNIKLIASYHRFDLTPSVDELEEVFKDAKKLNADIVKIATMVDEKRDLETLLLFTLKHRNDKIIIIGMGEKGIPSRIINPVFYSLITYASLNINSAPGQISLQDIVNIFRILGVRSN
mgnify:FL=1